MFGIGGSEILVILIIALLFLGPDKLPDAAKQISKGIRDLKKQSRVLQQTIENDEHIGGAIRDLKSALRGDELPVRPPVRKEPVKKPDDADPAMSVAERASADLAQAALAAHEEHGASALDTSWDHGPDGMPVQPGVDAKPQVTLPASAGEPDPDVATAGAEEHTREELAAMIRPPT
ncbi:MAG: twin-arginine translocase TatA/TatE family subunit, partial [Kofleriaceae bacterium]